MRLPTRVGGEVSSLIDKDAALRQIVMAIEGGVNYLDTAATYHLGASEPFLGKHVLNDGYRDKVNIATKLPCMTIRKKEAIRPRPSTNNWRSCRLATIDYYLLHSLDGATWDRMVAFDIVDFMDSIRASGRSARWASPFTEERTTSSASPMRYDWDFAQVQFNMVDEQLPGGDRGHPPRPR